MSGLHTRLSLRIAVAAPRARRLGGNVKAVGGVLAEFFEPSEGDLFDVSFGDGGHLYQPFIFR